MALSKNNIIYDELDKDNTYMFELLSPYNKVIIDYGDEPTLKLIGVKNNITGKESIMNVPGENKTYEFPPDFKIVFHNGI